MKTDFSLMNKLLKTRKSKCLIIPMSDVNIKNH